MSVHELEAAIIRLTPQQLFGLLTWLEMVHTQPSRQEGAQEQERELFDRGSVEPEDVDAAAN